VDPKIKTAATYSRASYTGTTIGNAVFDGRVRDGIGSDHCFMATVKKLLMNRQAEGPPFAEDCIHEEGIQNH
jgi:hypothetical protein